MLAYCTVCAKFIKKNLRTFKIYKTDMLFEKECNYVLLSRIKNAPNKFRLKNKCKEHGSNMWKFLFSSLTKTIFYKWNSKPCKQSMVSNDSNGNFWELSKICIICINPPSVTIWKIIPTQELIHLFIKVKEVSFLASSTYIKIKIKGY